MPTMEELEKQGKVPPAPEPLSRDDKIMWAKQGTVFDVINTVLKVTRKSGDGDDMRGDDDMEELTPGTPGTRTYWETLVKSDGRLYSFGLGGHADRDATMQALAVQCAHGPVEACVLSVLSTKRGTAFLVIAAAPKK